MTQSQCHNILANMDSILVIISASPFGIQDDAQHVIDNLNELYDDDLFMSSLSSDDIDWMESLMKDAEALYASFSENNYVPEPKHHKLNFEELMMYLCGGLLMLVIFYVWVTTLILAFGG
jgi:hypothetical protein